MRRGSALRRCGVVMPALLLLFACGGDDSGDDDSNGERSADGSEAELVTWMGALCDAAAGSIQGLPTPMAAPGATTEADRQPLLDFLVDAQAAVASATEDADALPAPPTAAARDVADTYRSDLDTLAEDLAGYAANASALPAESLDNVYVVAGVQVVSFQPGGEEMSEYLDGRTDLTEAYQQAPACSGEPTTETTSASSATGGTPEEREAALLADIQATFQDEPGGDQQVLDSVYSICAALDATDPDRYFPPENVDPAQASALAADLAGLSPAEVLDSLGRVMGNPVTVGVMASLGAEHICPEHTDSIEDWRATPG
jgi:hypothetical protein